MPNGFSTAHLYRPKLLTLLDEGYRAAQFRRDLIAGLTVGIVALPLSMAIAVASGVTPERGLYTAVAGGAVVSALSGSRYQIGGPAGAFIVLVAATVARYGIDGLLLTVLLSGFFLTLLGVLRVGGYIRLIPHAVTAGFTAGIAATIFASQIKDLFGLTLHGAEPGPFFPKLLALAEALPSANWASALVGIGSVALIAGLRHYRPAWPRLLIAVTAASVLAALLRLPCATIGSHFGGIPHGMPAPSLPPISWAAIWAVLPAAISFTLLGGIESLLSAKVGDAMTGRVHRSNMELVGQGIANIISALFGGISVTGTVARTATNIRAGAASPVAGLLHAGFVLAFLLVAAPLASYVPLAALAAVLVVVCWDMAEKPELARLARQARPGALLATTLLLTLAKDLTTGIAAGCALAIAFALWDRWRAGRLSL